MYEKQTWETGEVITANKLNNIEYGIHGLYPAYEGTVWFTGDIITADKLNNEENGVVGAGGGVDLKGYIEGTITSVVIPDGMELIGDNAFRACEALTSVTIPDSVTTIGRNSANGGYSFGDCKALTGIVVPASVTKIFPNTFSGCSSLVSATFLSETPPTLVSNLGGIYDIFPNTPSNLVIYVPATAVDAYKNDRKWKTYASRIQAIQE